MKIQNNVGTNKVDYRMKYYDVNTIFNLLKFKMTDDCRAVLKIIMSPYFSEK